MSVYNIGVFTSTRAEYGLLRRSIIRINNDQELNLLLYVTGSHLAPDLGYTVDEIKEDKLPIAAGIPIYHGKYDSVSLCMDMAEEMRAFTEEFARRRPDILVVLGDRYELLPVVNVALMLRIPVAHLCGGDVTFGAIDDSIRHAVTKMSYLHFPVCEEYGRRIMELGESPDRIFNFGDPALENIRLNNYLSRDEFLDFLGLPHDAILASVTFHPVTLENGTAEKEVSELIEAIRTFPQIHFIVTMANADADGDKINSLWKEATERYDNIHLYASLGSKNYLTLLKYSEFILGNSSSGIREAPSFHIPTVNIGDRQGGRIRATSIIDCEPLKENIIEAVNKALSPEFKEIASKTVNPFGDGNFSENFVNTIKMYLKEGKIDLKKKFYDVCLH